MLDVAMILRYGNQLTGGHADDGGSSWAVGDRGSARGNGNLLGGVDS